MLGSNYLMFFKNPKDLVKESLKMKYMHAKIRVKLAKLKKIEKCTFKVF